MAGEAGGVNATQCYLDGNDEVGPFSRIVCSGPENAGCNETVMVHAADDDDDWNWRTLSEEVEALAKSQGWLVDRRPRCPKHRAAR